MRIEVVRNEAISAQARSYAEYQVFAALTRSTGTRNVRSARVVLRPVKDDAGGDRAACTVIIRFEEADAVRVSATGPHPYAAINRAVERLNGAIEPASSEQ
jgi:ribosome-associated translation inhibitor RaiA